MAKKQITAVSMAEPPQPVRGVFYQQQEEFRSALIDLSVEMDNLAADTIAELKATRDLMAQARASAQMRRAETQAMLTEWLGDK